MLASGHRCRMFAARRKNAFWWNLIVFFNKNNWKLVLVITLQNRRFANFCKKLCLSHVLLSRKNSSKLCFTPSRVWKMKDETFFILEVMKINRISRRNGFWLILERCGPFSGAEWIAENSVFRLIFAISRVVFETSDVAVADAFCKNFPFADFEKLWLKQVFNCFY